MLNDMERHQIAREIWLHIQLHHGSIIALYAAWKDRDYIYLVLEWAPEVRGVVGCWWCAVCAVCAARCVVPRFWSVHFASPPSPQNTIIIVAKQQGNVFTFVQQRGGRLPESVAVPLIMEPTMSALHYIHGLVRFFECLSVLARVCDARARTQCAVCFCSCCRRRPQTQTHQTHNTQTE